MLSSNQKAALYSLGHVCRKPAYDIIVKLYFIDDLVIKRYYYVKPSMQKFIHLMKMENPVTLYVTIEIQIEFVFVFVYKIKFVFVFVTMMYLFCTS